MQQQELKSCPFCGKEFLDRWPCDFLDASGTNVVRCAWCHGAAPMAKWNTRAPARELDMSTKPGNLDTFAEHVHGIDAGVGGDVSDIAISQGSFGQADGSVLIGWRVSAEAAKGMGASSMCLPKEIGDDLERLRAIATWWETGAADRMGKLQAALTSALPDDREARCALWDAILPLVYAIATPPAAAAPDGFVMVPREPTKGMVSKAFPWLANWKYMRKADQENAVAAAYAAMLAAAPTPPVAMAPVIRYCKVCDGRGSISTGITEAPTTICERCEGMGTLPAAPANGGGS